MKQKYPRTLHVPFSPGISSDDKVIDTLNGFVGHEIVITEKLDGENSSLYSDGHHARSLDSKHHPSRDWLKKFHGEIAYKIPEGTRICGENLYAKHSIAYDDLLSYFYGFSVWEEHEGFDVALSWDETLMWFEELGIVPVPTLYRGTFSPKILTDLAASLDVSKQEGFVVRVVDEIIREEFVSSLEYGHAKIAKWVRPGHVQTEEHWMHQAVVPNKLRG